MTDNATAILARIAADDLEGVSAMLAAVGDQALASLDDCAGPRVVLALKSVEMADLLLRHGLATKQIGGWWRPGFGLKDFPPEVARHLVGRGMELSIHAASALGLVDVVEGLLDQRPELLHAKGGDGGRPLHFARDVETARLLVGRGAELDPRDDDHDSTPAQWRIGDAPEVTRYLLEHSATPDIFMAAALGDVSLAQWLIDEDPACTGYRIGHNRGSFPGIGFRDRGGTIYQWTIGFNVSPQEVAHQRGHRKLYELLMRHTPPPLQMLVACMLVDRHLAGELMAQHPCFRSELGGEDLELLAKCCWETNLNIEAVRLMLEVGFPVDVPEKNHGYLPLHNAAWCGHVELVNLLLEHGHPVDRRDPRFNATALGYALHSCLEARRHLEGDFARVIEALLRAGVPVDEGQYPTGDPALDEILAPHAPKR